MVISEGPSSRGPRRTVATDVWDPEAQIFDRYAVADLIEDLERIKRTVAAQREELERRGDSLGLIRDGDSVDIPEEWPNTPGSPIYYLRAAESYIEVAASGTVCRDQHPPVQKVHQPPPGDRWCCTHLPDPHCEP
jgi:hypothetical protein